MCYIITVALPHEARPFLDVFSRSRFEVEPDVPSEDKEVLGRHLTAARITVGGCSCGLLPIEPDQDIEESIEYRRKKYQAKGWSEGKIQRALEQVRKSAVRKAADRAHNSEWTHAFLAAVAEVASNVSELRLLVRWEPSTDTVEPDAFEEVCVSVGELMAAQRGLPTGRVVVVRSDRGGSAAVEGGKKGKA